MITDPAAVFFVLAAVVAVAIALELRSRVCRSLGAALVGILLAGISRLPIGRLERHTHAVAGFSLILCGAMIQFLGL